VDASGSESFFSLRYGQSRSRLVFLLLQIALSGCLISESRPAPRASSTGFAVLAQDIARVRGLRWRREIVFAGFTDETGQRKSASPFELQEIEQAYKNIGLLPDGISLAATTEYRRLRKLSYYDPASARVYLAPEAAKLGAPFAMTDTALASEAPFGFAIVGALLEQNFRWQEKMDSQLLEDRRLALHALTVGDAALTLIARARGEGVKNWSANDLADAARFAVELEKSAARLPEFLRQKLTFPFREGSQFVLWALRAKGWPGVDALYGNPPTSTAEILHPERYYLLREAPLRFFPATLLRSMKTGPLVEHTLGEYLIRGLLATAHRWSFASDTATAWRGDQLFAFRESEFLPTAWFSAWRSAAEAAAFQRAYRTVLEKRQRVRFDSKQAGSTTALIATSRGAGLWLQSSGSVVLLLCGIPVNRLSEFAEEAWKDLEIGPEPTAVRFDSARRWLQRGSVSLAGK
jgi:hypothetical protein